VPKSKVAGGGCLIIIGTEGREKASGTQPDRRELLKLLKAIALGDVVTVTRIDRLARSTFDLFAIVKQIVDAGGQFRSLAEPWTDTVTNTGRLIGAGDRSGLSCCSFLQHRRPAPSPRRKRSHAATPILPQTDPCDRASRYLPVWVNHDMLS
jgi:hypothetical protein